MSDPVTNVEIEDVLSSIRRLVSDGDKARTRDSAPVNVEDTREGGPAESFTSRDATQDNHPDESAKPDDRTDRLVLTPAFLVVDGGEAKPDEPEDDQSHNDDHHDHHEDGGHEDTDADDAEHNADADVGDDDASDIDLQKTGEHHAPEGDVDEDYDSDDDIHDVTPRDSSADETTDEFDADELDDPIPLEDMVWESVEDAKRGGPVREALQSTHSIDRSELAATIAELEAAVSSGDDDYELDGSEDMGEAIAWPGSARSTDNIEDAQTDDAPAHDDASADMSDRENQSDGAPEMAAQPVDEPPQAEAEPDIYADDDLDGLLDVGGVTLDEAALRELVGEVVREELAGPMGERITRNVRKLVRREIYRVLSSQEFE